MDYITKLDAEELNDLCQHIMTANVIRKFFQQKPRLFGKIFHGRAKKLTDDHAFKLLVSNVSMVEIENFVNLWIQRTLDDTNNHINALIGEGADFHTAILKAMHEDIFFHDIPALFIKLAYPEFAEEYLSLLEASCKLLETQDTDFGNDSIHDSKSPTTDIGEFASEIQTEETSVFEIDAEKYKNQAMSLQARIDELETNLAESQQKLTEASAVAERYKRTADDLNTQLMLQEREDADLKSRIETAENALTRYHCLEDRGDFSEPLDESHYPYLSLCVVSGQKQKNGTGLVLERLADVVDGMIQRQYDETSPFWTLYDNNRSDIPPRFFGIWAWTLKYNPKSKRENYIDSYYYDSPIEIIRMRDCITLKDLIQRLTAGVSVNISCGKILFAIQKKIGCLEGLLCRENELSISENGVKLSDSVADLPLYVFQESDILQIGTKHYYKSIVAGLPRERVQVWDPLLIVRRLLLARLRWSALKNMGASKREWQKLRSYLDELPIEDFYQEIAKNCACDESRAKQYAAEFVRRAQSYLEGTDVESRLLEELVYNRPDLMSRCKELLRADWEADTHEEIAKKNEELEKLSFALSEAHREADALSSERDCLFAEITQYTAEREEQEKLAADVETEVRLRIEKARRHAAQFIASQAFSAPLYLQQVQTADTKTGNPICYRPGMFLPSDNLEDGDQEDFLSILKENLYEAGVSNIFSSDLGAYLYGAFLGRVPLLLCGPNGRDIADAFSAARFGRTAGYVDCASAANLDLAQTIEQADDPVVVLQRPLQPAFLSQLPAVLSLREKMVFGVEPLAEELLLEPRGMYNYLFPFLTEFVIDHPASSEYCGMDQTAAFQEQTPQRERVHLNKSLRITSLANDRLKQLLCGYRALAEHQQPDPDTEAVFSLFPYAYATNQALELLDQNGFGKISPDMEKEFRACLGEME